MKPNETDISSSEKQDNDSLKEDAVNSLSDYFVMYLTLILSTINHVEFFGNSSSSRFLWSFRKYI
jgi:hypothetical protein